MKRKKELFIVLTSLLVIIFSVSVAYFATQILGTGKDVSVTSADLKVVFTSGNGTIANTELEPGWSSGENTFTVKNETSSTYTYNIIIKDLLNTFVTEGFLVYKITSTDGGYNMTEFADLPKTSSVKDRVLAYNVSIEKGKTHTYTIVVNYNSSDTVDQSDDMEKELSGQIYITKGSERSTLANQLLLDNPTISTRSDFSTPFTTNTANTLYKTTENGTDVYYFAGQDYGDTLINNWVKFGKYQNDYIKYKGYASSTSSSYKEYSTMEECTSATSYKTNCTAFWYASKGDDMYWRIIRTNADGSIRLLYSGTSPDTTNGSIGESEYNGTINAPKYIGYMYGNSDTTLEEARTNTNDSTIKTYIDNWYENNLTSYTNYLSNDAIYCDDRELASGGTYSTTVPFSFRPYERLYTNKTPTYDCTNSKDAFSSSSAEAKLKYPIALMTADEISYAGGVVAQNASMWYYSNSLEGSSISSNYWWLLSPAEFRRQQIVVSTTWAVSAKNNPGRMISITVTTASAVRPVTSLKSCAQWKSGDGSADNPYEIEMNGGC